MNFRWYVSTISLVLIMLGVGCRKDSPVSTSADGNDSLSVLRAAFSEPENCRPCHPNHVAEWETSMHAYAMTDPVFLLLNEIGQERSKNSLDQFCVKCHTPIGSLLQETPPGFDAGEISSLARKAIQCDVCHLIRHFERGRSITAFRLDRVRQGSIPNPKANAYHESEYDSRYLSSDICSPCHDILSPTGVRVEATSTEWDDSPYAAMGLECQNCHMAEYTGPAANGGETRTVHRHYFTGVDVPLTDFPGREETEQRVAELLKNSLSMTVQTGDSVSVNSPMQINVVLNNNRTGHRIPSGSTFERQMWIELILRQNGQVIFESGTLDGNQDLRNSHSDEVLSGMAAADSALVLYRGIAKKAGEEISFFWEADEVVFNTLEPFVSKKSVYSIIAPAQTGELDVSVRLLFRAFPPYVLRAIGLPELVSEVPVFEMEIFQTTITVT